MNIDVTNFEKIKYENGVPMVFRGTFFGEPVYSQASLSSYTPTTVDPQETVIIGLKGNPLK